MLPLVQHAQEQGWLPRPCTLVLFDLHHDGLAPRCPERLASFLERPVSIEVLIEACEQGLSELNDDWITAGMEFGLFDNAVVFGVDCLSESYGLSKFVDRRGQEHQLFYPELPGAALGNQGSLSDAARSGELAPLWEALGWKLRGSDPPELARVPKIALDFDLDCFAMYWREYVLPWTDEVWSAEFARRSSDPRAAGLTGLDFVKGLIERAGLVTFAEEPSYCGGPDKAAQIFSDLNRHLFGGALVRRDVEASSPTV